MIFSSIEKPRQPILLMWIELFIYSLSTNVSFNNLNVLLEPREVKYLGHIFGKEGVRVDPKKIEAMKDWPRPKTLKILHGFMGLT
jgi:hypothetical protein